MTQYVQSHLLSMLCKAMCTLESIDGHHVYHLQQHISHDGIFNCEFPFFLVSSTEPLTSKHPNSTLLATYTVSIFQLIFLLSIPPTGAIHVFRR